MTSSDRARTLPISSRRILRPMDSCISWISMASTITEWPIGITGGPTLGNNIETTLGFGDSGGPAFLNDNGTLVLAGVNTFLTTPRHHTRPAVVRKSGWWNRSIEPNRVDCFGGARTSKRHAAVARSHLRRTLQKTSFVLRIQRQTNHDKTPPGLCGCPVTLSSPTRQLWPFRPAAGVRADKQIQITLPFGFVC